MAVEPAPAPVRWLGYAALAVVTLTWSINYLFVKYLTAHFDAHTQNAWRYSAAAVFLLALAFARGRPPFPNLRQARTLLAPALPSVTFQVTWVFSLYYLYPGMSALLSQSIILFSAVLAYAMLPEERPVIASRPYLLGVGLLIVGSVGLVLVNEQIDRAPLMIGVALTLASCAAWAVYGITIQRVVRTIDPVSAFAGVSIYNAAALMTLACLQGAPLDILHAPLQANLMLVASGVISIGIAHSLYFVGIRAVGVAVASVMILSTPIITAVLSAIIFGEAMGPRQILFGALLMAGAVVATLAREWLVFRQARRL